MQKAAKQQAAQSTAGKQGHPSPWELTSFHYPGAVSNEAKSLGEKTTQTRTGISKTQPDNPWVDTLWQEDGGRGKEHAEGASAASGAGAPQAGTGTKLHGNLPVSAIQLQYLTVQSLGEKTREGISKLGGHDIQLGIVATPGGSKVQGGKGGRQTPTTPRTSHSNKARNRERAP